MKKIYPDKTKIAKKIDSLGKEANAVESGVYVYQIETDQRKMGEDLEDQFIHQTIVANSFGEAERLFYKIHPESKIYSITLVAADVINMWAQ